MTAMTATSIQPNSRAARERLAQLYALRSRLDAEILAAEALARGEAAAEKPRQRRSRHDIPPCGSEAGYHRHRYRARKGLEEPLDPKVDPCGCVAAHAEHNRHRDAVLGAAREDARRQLRRPALSAVS